MLPDFHLKVSNPEHKILLPSKTCGWTKMAELIHTSASLSCLISEMSFIYETKFNVRRSCNEKNNMQGDFYIPKQFASLFEACHMHLMPVLFISMIVVLPAGALQAPFWNSEQPM